MANTYQVNGTPSTISSTNNNGGVVKNCGTLAFNRDFINSKLGIVDHNLTIIDIAESRFAEKVDDNGLLAILVAGKYVIKRNSLQLAGLKKENLQTGAAEFNGTKQRSVHARNPIRTRHEATAIRTAHWTKAYGYDSGYPEIGLSGLYNIDSGNNAIDELVDSAVNVSPGNPGTLTINEVGTIPTHIIYDGKYGAIYVTPTPTETEQDTDSQIGGSGTEGMGLITMGIPYIV